MKHFNRKIKSVLFITLVVLITFVSFSRAGILFSAKDDNVITVSTKNKAFEPKKYVAQVGNIEGKLNANVKTTKTSEIVKTSETTKKDKIEVTSTSIVSTTQTTISESSNSWNGPVLSKSKGAVNGPSGRETYYNLNMTGVVRAMRNLGFSEEEYPYWVRDDGVKMLGSYVIVAASYDIHPKGSIVESSLGSAIVCDTGGFAKRNPNQLDIAVTW